jgi:hypothetical protein
VGFLKFFYEHLTRGGIVVFRTRPLCSECFNSVITTVFPLHKVTSILNDYHDKVSVIKIWWRCKLWYFCKLLSLGTFAFRSITQSSQTIIFRERMDNHHDILLASGYRVRLDSLSLWGRYFTNKISRRNRLNKPRPTTGLILINISRDLRYFALGGAVYLIIALPRKLPM